MGQVHAQRAVDEQLERVSMANRFRFVSTEGENMVPRVRRADAEGREEGLGMEVEDAEVDEG